MEQPERGGTHLFDVVALELQENTCCKRLYRTIRSPTWNPGEPVFGLNGAGSTHVAEKSVSHVMLSPRIQIALYSIYFVSGSKALPGYQKPGKPGFLVAYRRAKP